MKLLSESKKTFKTIPLRQASSMELERLSREGILSLSLPEMKAIQKYFVELRRDPTDLELETLAQTWSEHCNHKTFKAAYDYEEAPSPGKSLGSRSYQNLLKETIVKTT